MMVFLNTPLRHSEWRKLAKKLRRKRIRQAKAKERDQKLLSEQQRLEKLPDYQKWLQEQEQLEIEKEKEEQLQAAERAEQWRKVEEEAQRQWRELQKKIALAREEKMKQNMKIKLEWEKEQQRLKEIQIAKEKQLEEKRLQQQKHEKELLDFLEKGGSTPEHLKTEMETNPGKSVCPFFKKVSACRFFDVCSRNHIRPTISKTLLITNFFSHISLEVKENEHGSDSSLEFEKEDTFEFYKEFFEDVVLEFEKCGSIKRFFTCCNHEAHLRGNVYVQYGSTREALVAYHKFNGRWYAGRQLNVEFCSIDNWHNAICGLYFRNKCPKGNTCNFLHIFNNPKGLYMHFGSSQRNTSRRESHNTNSIDDSWDQRESSERSHWRWSESPEPLPNNSKTKHNRHKSNGISSRRSRKASSSRKRRRRSRSTSRRSRKTSGSLQRRSRRSSSRNSRGSNKS